jgi:hypothetical protein
MAALAAPNDERVFFLFPGGPEQEDDVSASGRNLPAHERYMVNPI